MCSSNSPTDLHGQWPQFETLLSELSTTFTHLSAERVDGEISQALKRIVESLGNDRATFFEFSEDKRQVHSRKLLRAIQEDQFYDGQFERLGSPETISVNVRVIAGTNRNLAKGSMTLETMERRHILGVLEQTGWRIRGTSGAAEILGLKPTTLEARMAKLGSRRQRRPSNMP